MKIPFLSNLGNLFPKLRSQMGAQADAAAKDSCPFRVVQIEVTSRCSTGCLFCPHHALIDQWVEGDLPLELYREKIAPHLGLFDLVYLQGWGEPMLHPHLWEMLSLTRQHGCRTGFTTNGARLQAEQNHRLLDYGVNMISVSFAGNAAPVHESLRTNSDFTVLCQNFESLANLKKQNNVADPWLELHFLMTRANLSEFPSLVMLAASLGADEVVATNLTYSPNLALDQAHIFGEQALPEDIELINQARETAARLELPLRIYPLQEEPQTLVCDADPVNTVYVNHRGEVAPCVYLGLTVAGQIPRFFQGEPHPFDAFSFGNVSNSFEQVLWGKERAKFTSAFNQRSSIGSSPLAMFSYMSGHTGGGETSDGLPAPPVPCQHCYKMLGV